jgi:hypothetical protein
MIRTAMMAVALMASSAHATLLEPHTTLVKPGETFYVSGYLSHFSENDGPPYSDWTTLEVGDPFVMSAEYARTADDSAGIRFDLTAGLFHIAGAFWGAPIPITQWSGWTQGTAADMNFGAETYLFMPDYLTDLGAYPELLAIEDVLGTFELLVFGSVSEGDWRMLKLYMVADAVAVPLPPTVALLALVLVPLVTSRRKGGR